MAKFWFPQAEAFIQHRGERHPPDNILRPMLGDDCREFDSQVVGRRNS